MFFLNTLFKIGSFAAKSSFFPFFFNFFPPLFARQLQYFTQFHFFKYSQLWLPKRQGSDIIWKCSTWQLWLQQTYSATGVANSTTNEWCRNDGASASTTFWAVDNRNGAVKGEMLVEVQRFRPWQKGWRVCWRSKISRLSWPENGGKQMAFESILKIRNLAKVDNIGFDSQANKLARGSVSKLSALSKMPKLRKLVMTTQCRNSYSVSA